MLQPRRRTHTRSVVLQRREACIGSVADSTSMQLRLLHAKVWPTSASRRMVKLGPWLSLASASAVLEACSAPLADADGLQTSERLGQRFPRALQHGGHRSLWQPIRPRVARSPTIPSVVYRSCRHACEHLDWRNPADEEVRRRVRLIGSPTLTATACSASLASCISSHRFVFRFTFVPGDLTS